MSFDAIRWALDQPVKAATKLVLVVMADCVNAEAADMVCWPSYAFIAKRAGLNTKTVEASVFRLKLDRYIVDTGRRAGDTGKVVVYRLNTTENGGVSPGPQTPNANGTRPHNATENGCISTEATPPKTEANPPKSGEQSPQKVEEIPPKVGVRTRKKQEGTGKEAGRALASIPGVSDELLADWMVARKQQPVTATALAGLEREAAKVGLSVAEAITYCCEAGWRGFNAGWYSARVGGAAPTRNAKPNKHAAAAAGIFDAPQHYSEVIDV